jgi:predicted DNA-binding protein (MmcQ/YjbR family)
MNIEELREYCLSLDKATEGMPFGPTVLVFKVGGKMFLLAALDTQPLQFNVKCEPEQAQYLREKYSSVIPGYHMSKVHWNTIIVNGEVDNLALQQWINDSYKLIVASLPKSVQKNFRLPNP